MAGDVATLGPGVSDLAPGDRVALGPSSCGRCHWCLTGQERACREHYNVTVRYGDAWGPGGFAEYKLHPADGLFRIHDAPYEHAAMAEPLSCAIHAARLLDVAVGQDVVVLGAGVMGLLNVVALKKRGARVIVSEMDSSRLELARVMGADELVDASRSDPVASVRELTEGRGSEAVIAAIGNPEASEQALEMLAERGRYVVFASAHPERTLEIRPNRLHNHEQGVFGVVSKDKGDFYTAVRLIRYRQVDLSPLIQASFALTGLRDALELAVQPGTYRVIVTP
jgi:L-iditol 2-dehydrogenase